MRCTFCGAVNSRGRQSCLACGGPLGCQTSAPKITEPSTSTQPIASPKTAVVAAPPKNSPPPLPLAPQPIVPLPVVVPPPIPKPAAAPLLISRRALAENAPRLVAALWVGEGADALPVFVAQNGAFHVWDAARDALHSLTPKRSLRAPSPVTHAVSAREIEPCGATIATARASGQIVLQRLQRDGERGVWKAPVFATIPAHRGRIGAFSFAGNRLYSAGSDGAVIQICVPDSVNCGAKTRAPEVVLDGLDALCCLAVSPDGGRLALGGDDGQLQVWFLEDGKSANRLDWATGKNHAPLKTLAFSPNGNMLLCGDVQGDFCLRAARSGHELQRFSGPTHAPAPVFAPDSRLLARVSPANEIEIFDCWTGKLSHTLGAAAGEMQTLAFAPRVTGKSAAAETLLCGGTSRQISLWKIA